uniref:Putative secreted peptide n=1 Tax=Anopheles braziliensis TaxID=58242 RepID=A0A2M3ZUI7_9DIPT
MLPRMAVNLGEISFQVFLAAPTAAAQKSHGMPSIKGRVFRGISAFMMFVTRQVTAHTKCVLIYFSRLAARVRQQHILR